MDTSVFTDKNSEPGPAELRAALAASFELWELVRAYVLNKYPAGLEEWNFPGIKYGWSYRIKDKKRAIIYLLPRENYFMVAFVFGDKAVAEVQKSGIAQAIKTELTNARKYAEGRGIRIPVKNTEILQDIYRLVDIKIGPS
ncbi:MAG: DUF3788 domain-containing protein [Bacteroidales bacterium]